MLLMFRDDLLGEGILLYCNRGLLISASGIGCHFQFANPRSRATVTGKSFPISLFLSLTGIPVQPLTIHIPSDGWSRSPRVRSRNRLSASSIKFHITNPVSTVQAILPESKTMRDRDQCSVP